MKTLLLLGCVTLGLLAGQALGQVVPPGPPGGVQSTLADQFWPWIASLHASTNPLFDQTGAQAYQGLQNVPGIGEVFFLAGGPGPNSGSNDGKWHRSFSVPSGVPLFFPIINSGSFNSPLLNPPDCTTMACILNPPFPYPQQIAFQTDYPDTLYARLNGVDLVTDFSPYWQLTNVNDLGAPLPQFSTPPNDNVFGIDGVVSGGVGQDGYYMELLLAPGDYTLAFGSDIGKDPFFPGSPWATIDTIDVIPEPSTWAMMLIGFAGLGYAAYVRARKEPVTIT